MQSILMSTLSSSLYYTVLNLIQNKKEKNIIIDPFSCLTKLSLMSYLENGTKISINNNKINFNQPEYNQGLIRFIYGDNREDLHNLFAPIQKCKEWYYDKNNEDIVYFFDKAILGLQNLKKAYGQYATIQHTIDYYITILVNNCNQENMNGENREENQETNFKNIDTIKQFLMQLWSEREIKIIIDLFKEYESKQEETEKIYIYNSIINYCNMKEEKLNKFLEEKSSILDS